MLLEEARKAIDHAEKWREETEIRDMARVEAEIAQAHALIAIAELLNMVIGSDYGCGPCLRVDTGLGT